MATNTLSRLTKEPTLIWVLGILAILLVALAIGVRPGSIAQNQPGPGGLALSPSAPREGANQRGESGDPQFIENNSRPGESYNARGAADTDPSGMTGTEGTTTGPDLGLDQAGGARPTDRSGTGAEGTAGDTPLNSEGTTGPPEGIPSEGMNP